MKPQTTIEADADGPAITADPQSAIDWLGKFGQPLLPATFKLPEKPAVQTDDDFFPEMPFRFFADEIWRLEDFLRVPRTPRKELKEAYHALVGDDG
jgi:hypothetical protein